MNRVRTGLLAPLAVRAVTVSAFAIGTLAACFVEPVGATSDASAILKRAGVAMGAEGLRTLSYAAEGNGYTFGQAYVPGKPWPRITVHGMTRTINYETGSMRDQITLSRAEPKGGGGYPLAGQQTNDQYLGGALAWNVTGGNPVPGPRFISERTHQLWVTPHGALKAAQKNGATVDFVTEKGRSLAAVRFTEPGRLQATIYLNGDNLVERVESRYPDAVLGETAAVTRYSEYRETGNLRFPGRISQSIGGHPALDVIVTRVDPNAPADIAVPDAVKNAVERVATDKVADGVWFVSGGSHNSVAIEMKDHLVLVEAPLNDGRTGPVLDAVKKLAPGKSIRYVVNSHAHFDHSGGLRAAVAEGATIVTQAGNKAYLDKAFASRGKIAPDLLTRSGKKAKFMLVKDTGHLSDGKRVIELHRLQGSVHSDTMLMAYLPAEKLLIEADAYTPGAAPQAAAPNANNINLVENIERLKLQVERILPLHGRVVSVADLYTAAGRTAPAR